MARKKTASRPAPKRRAARPRVASLPPPPPINEQLKTIFARLRKKHPNLVGIGIGFKREGPQQKTTPILSIRLIVHKKPRRNAPLPAALKPLPSFLYLRTLALGQSVRVRVPVDVEGIQLTRPSVGFGVHSLRAASFVAWHESGTLKFGVLSAAHAFHSVGQRVGVQGLGGNPTGTVRALSDWRMNGLDCAVVEIDRADLRLQDAGLSLPALPPQIDQIVAALGDAADDLSCVARFWGFADEPEMRAVAYYAKYPMNYMDGSTVFLSDVIECAALPGNKFRPGQSGSLWSAQLPPGLNVPLAIQSHMIHSGRRAFGCACASTTDHIRQLLNDQTAVLLFTIDELRAHA